MQALQRVQQASIDRAHAEVAKGEVYQRKGLGSGLNHLFCSNIDDIALIVMFCNSIPPELKFAWSLTLLLCAAGVCIT